MREPTSAFPTKRTLAILGLAALLAAPLFAAPAPVRRAAAPARAVHATPATPAPAALAASARAKEELGLYEEAAGLLRAVRARSAFDADLELALALDEARTGHPDSAWARLDTPRMRAALHDTLPPARHVEYAFERDPLWLDGRFTGWHWYLARARAELALELGRWGDALDAARIAARARPVSGKEHLLLAIAAGRAGDDATARREAASAAALDPMLPEALYLRGLWAWRDGNRAAARPDFERAIAADSGYRAPALALVRLRLPSARPDSLPSRFLLRVRRVGLLTSAERPKQEEAPRYDQFPGLYGTAPELTVPDSLKAGMQMVRPIHLLVTILVDERGRPVLDDLPALTLSQMPQPLLEQILQLASSWRFRPAVMLGHPTRAWASVELVLNP